MSPEVFVLILCPLLLSAYQAPEDKEDIFSSRSCPAFLVFETVAYLSDMTIELPCHCKPEDVLSVVWFYQNRLGPEHAKVLTDFSGTSVIDSSKVGRDVSLRERFSIRLFSLLIFRARQTDSGHYVCGTASGEFFYGYDVDIQVARNVLFPWNLTTRPQEARSKSSEQFRVFTSHWPWSVCDRCDVQGEQVRVGICYVMSEYLQVRYLRKVRNVTSCGSASVPLRFGLDGADYGAELRVRSCEALCPPKPSVDPQPQSILEFLGYSNAASPGVRVHHHNQPIGTDLVLSCPKARPQHVVAWDRDSTPLYRSLYLKGLDPDPRVFIDLGNNLHVRSVRMEDKGTYYCWIQGRKAAEIRLGVYARLGPRWGISRPEAAFGLIVIVVFYGGFTAVFVPIITVQFIREVIPKQRLCS